MKNEKRMVPKLLNYNLITRTKCVNYYRMTRIHLADEQICNPQQYFLSLLRNPETLSEGSTRYT